MSYGGTLDLVIGVHTTAHHLAGDMDVIIFNEEQISLQVAVFAEMDDVLDVTADSQTLGKTAGKDAAANKPTYVTLMGLDYAQKQAKELQETAIASLNDFGSKADALKDLALLVVNRAK